MQVFSVSPQVNVASKTFQRRKTNGTRINQFLILSVLKINIEFSVKNLTHEYNNLTWLQ